MSEPHLDELPEGMLALGSALIAATVSADGEPRAARASSWQVVDPTERRIRVAMCADDPVFVANLGLHAEPGSVRVSVTGADVLTFASVQLKGSVVALDAPDADDRAAIEHHNDVFVGKIEAVDGHPADVVRRFLPIEHVMVEVLVDEVYDQTPGPGAGAVLRAGTL